MQETQLGRGAEVLTLEEAAAFLRVTEDALNVLAAKDAIPAQNIAGEWRFLKRALADWLRYGHRYREFRGYPLWLLGFPPLGPFLTAVEQVVSKSPPSADENGGTPGSKEAVLKHFGVFRDDNDLEDRLDDARAHRGAAG